MERNLERLLQFCFGRVSMACMNLATLDIIQNCRAHVPLTNWHSRTNNKRTNKNNKKCDDKRNQGPLLSSLPKLTYAHTQSSAS
eukprot:2881427-Amphidinium_carterae.1